MDIRALFFDLYGTLADWLPNAESIQQRCALAEGLNVDQLKIRLAYPEANRFLDLENTANPIALRDKDARRTFFVQYESNLLHAAGYSVTSEIAARIWDRVSRYPKKFALFDDALPSMEGLREMGLKLGVISNIGFELQQTLVQLGIAQYLDVSVSSVEARVAKPDPKIFRLALGKVGVSANQTIHVGDSLETDVLGARSAGMLPVLLKRSARSESQSHPQRIQTLLELPAIVEKARLSQ